MELAGWESKRAEVLAGTRWGDVEVKIAPLRLLQVVHVRGSRVARSKGPPELPAIGGTVRSRYSCCR